MPPSEKNRVATSAVNKSTPYESVERFSLAISKDVRYIQQCADLLKHILGSAAPARTSRILVEYISWILYILLTTKTRRLRKEGGTLNVVTSTPGMEVCQVQYVQENVAREEATVWSRLSSLLLPNSSMTMAALVSVSILYGIRFQSHRILRNEATDSATNHNQYQGQARRNVYLLQREAMIRRSRELVSGPATATAYNTTTDATVNVKHGNDTPRGADPSHVGDQILPRLRTILRAMVVALDRALASKVTNGPHDPLAATTNIPETTSSISASTTLEDRLQQVFMWIFQFHLACYCISGNHPTIFHRFIKDRVVMSESKGHDGEPVPASSSIMPMVGALLLCRLSYQLLFHAISKPLVRYCATIRYSSLLHRRKTIHSVGSIATAPGPHAVTVIGRSPRTERASHMACYICQQPPLYPSCLIPCGHVFCWYCIQQWITDHDANCPICRERSSSKDVMLLYNV